MEDYCKLLLEDFLKTSFSTVTILVDGVVASRGQNVNRRVTLFRYVNGKKVSVPFTDERFYLRGSVEYTNPQLTVEEVQGIVGTKAYVQKYDGTLISKRETELIEAGLNESKGSYLDFVDSIKYTQLRELTDFCGVDLSLYSLRMPLSTLQVENKDDLLHYIISQSNSNYESVEEAYTCMGRSMTKRTTLLTVPHSKKGFGSKRAARGKLHFEDEKFLDATVKYKTTALYPNAIDPEDVAVAVCDDSFTVKGEKLADYSYTETPSSPQFFLYSLGSPEDAAVWHGIGAFGSSQLLQSYSSARKAISQGKLIKDLNKKYHLNVKVPLQFNLAPEGMWSHPIHRNIDASIGSVDDLGVLARRGMRLEYLSAFK